ncbi:hypothetical protein DMH25_22320 [Streptomyces sp. WAC 01325]|nr:hypothetical protein DMH25_22320 [Streptomyces sp. WAC 01325]
MVRGGPYAGRPERRPPGSATSAPRGGTSWTGGSATPLRGAGNCATSHDGPAADRRPLTRPGRRSA